VAAELAVDDRFGAVDVSLALSSSSLDVDAGVAVVLSPDAVLPASGVVVAEDVVCPPDVSVVVVAWVVVTWVVVVP
jgi:hypothetical protein